MNFFFLENTNVYLNNPLCLCPTGYTGTFCDKLIDACIADPCFSGVNCTNTVENKTYTAVCSGCPSGYSGNGRKCFGMFYKYYSDLIKFYFTKFLHS